MKLKATAARKHGQLTSATQSPSSTIRQSTIPIGFFSWPHRRLRTDPNLPVPAKASLQESTQFNFSKAACGEPNGLFRETFNELLSPGLCPTTHAEECASSKPLIHRAIRSRRDRRVVPECSQAPSRRAQTLRGLHRPVGRACRSGGSRTAEVHSPRFLASCRPLLQGRSMSCPPFWGSVSSCRTMKRRFMEAMSFNSSELEVKEDNFISRHDWKSKKSCLFVHVQKHPTRGSSESIVPGRTRGRLMAWVSTNSMASHLGVKSSSVTAMVQVLSNWAGRSIVLTTGRV